MSGQAFGRPEQDAEVLITPIRRRPRSRKSVYTRPVNYSRIILTTIFLAALVAGAYYYVYANYLVAHAPYAVSLDGRVLAVLRSREDAVLALRRYRARYAPKSPGVVAFVEGEPLIRPYGDASDVLALDKAADRLSRQLSPMYDGYAIFVYRKPMALLPTEDDALRAVSLMLERGLKGRQGIPTFKQRVTIDHLRLNLDEGKSILLLPPTEVAAELVRPPLPRVHIVELGDNFWKIATANGITVDDLKALNPGVDYRRLHEGDRIKLPDLPSPVAIVVRATEEKQPAAVPPKDNPKPADSGASAENRAPKKDDNSVAAPPVPSVDRSAEDKPAPESAPRNARRAPAPWVRRSAPRPMPAPAPAPPARRRPPATVRPPENPPSPPAAPPDTVARPKSYTDRRMPLKQKNPAPAENGE